MNFTACLMFSYYCKTAQIITIFKQLSVCRQMKKFSRAARAQLTYPGAWENQQ